MRANEMKKEIHLLVEKVNKNGIKCKLDINTIGGKLVEIKENEKEGRDISPRLSVRDLYHFMLGFNTGINETMETIREYAIRDKLTRE